MKIMLSQITPASSYKLYRMARKLSSDLGRVNFEVNVRAKGAKVLSKDDAARIGSKVDNILSSFLKELESEII